MRRMDNIVLRLLLGLLLAAAAVPAQEQGETMAPAEPSVALTYDGVKEFIEAYDGSFSTRQTEAVMRFFAEDMVIVSQAKPADGGGVTRYNRGAFTQLLNDTLPRVDEFKKSRSRQVIRLLEQGRRAQVHSLLQESARIGSQTLHARSQELVTIELVDGQPRIVKIQSVELDK